MKLLLDTHIILWMLSGSDLIDEETKRMIMDPSNQIYYSIVTPWEVEIKHLKHPQNFSLSGEQTKWLCEQAGFNDVPITSEHVLALKEIHPLDPALHHSDPFDKMLLAQAIRENMVLITHDDKFKNYRSAHLYVC